MNDLGKALLNKVDEIIDIWVEKVRRDIKIDSNKGMTYEAVHNGLPSVLASVATMLTTAFADEDIELEGDAAAHGAVRAKQGFDIVELVREYRTLNNVLIVALEPDLMTGTVPEVIKALRKIDEVIDRVVIISVESYVSHRLDLLEQMHGQLLLTNQELTRLVQIQKDNVSHLAHELKNPLNSIIGFSSVLLRKQRKQLTDSPPESIEMKQIERILNNGQQLLRLINNTLEVSRYESEQLALKVEPIHAPMLIKVVTESFEATARDKQVVLKMDCDRAPSQVTTDSLRLQQILTNLVSNAIRYTDVGEVTISCYLVDEDTWAIAVCDTGKGISSDLQPKIFEPYFRAGSKSDYAPESSGLGLTIVNKLVQLLQGRIELTSEIDKGSTFVVILPLTLNVSSAAKAQPSS